MTLKMMMTKMMMMTRRKKPREKGIVMILPGFVFWVIGVCMWALGDNSHGHTFLLLTYMSTGEAMKANFWFYLYCTFRY